MDLTHDHRTEVPGRREGEEIHFAPSGAAEPVDEPGDFRQARDGGIAGHRFCHGPSITRKPEPAQALLRILFWFR